MKLNKKNFKKFESISDKIIATSENYDFQADKLTKKYNINFNADDLLDNPDYYYYTEELVQSLAEYEKKQSILNAKRVAELIIGYNIAHRGKKLHPATIMRKIKKIPETHAELIYSTITNDRFNSPTLIDGPYLHSVLHDKYGVLLLDEKYFGYLYAILNDPRIKLTRKQYEKIINIQKMFHSATVKSYLNNKQK